MYDSECVRFGVCVCVCSLNLCYQAHIVPAVKFFNVRAVATVLQQGVCVCAFMCVCVCAHSVRDFL